MKRLYIMRHAKSDWDSGVSSDFERPLNKRGKKDAPFMGEYIKNQDIKPDLILCSPAERAMETASYFAKASEYQNEIIYVKAFYDGNISSIIERLNTLDDNINSVILIGHNPTWESLIELLSEKRLSVTMTTASIACIKLKDTWSNLEVYSNKLEWITNPKSIRK